MASREQFEEFPYDESLPPHLSGAGDGCRRAMLALTALFDGEANEQETRLACAHLEACGQCEVLWQTWTHHRYLMRRLPAAPVPPGLLVRVMTAIRLLSLMPQAGQRLNGVPQHYEPQATKAHDARLLSEVVWVTGTQPFAPRRNRNVRPIKIEAPRELPPLDPLAPMPPSYLHDEILRRTVGAVTSAAAPAPLVDELPYETVVPVTKRRHSRSRQFMPALTPMLAAWLVMLAGRAGMLPTLSAPPAKVPVAESAAKPSAASFAKPAPTTVRNFAKALAKAFVPAVPNSASAETLDRTEESATRVETAVVDVTRPAPVVVYEVPTVTTVKAAPTLEVAVATASAPAVNPTVKKITLPVALTVVHRAPAPRLRPATTAASMEIRMRHAEWGAPSPVLSPPRRLTSFSDDRVATPVASVPATEDVEGESTAETLEHVARLNDDRPDDVGTVLDDFRTAIASNPDEEMENPSLES